MPDKTITLTDAEASALDAIATARGTTADALLLAEAKAQIAEAQKIDYDRWFVKTLPLADKQRIFDAKTA